MTIDREAIYRRMMAGATWLVAPPGPFTVVPPTVEKLTTRERVELALEKLKAQNELEAFQRSQQDVHPALRMLDQASLDAARRDATKPPPAVATFEASNVATVRIVDYGRQHDEHTLDRAIHLREEKKARERERRMRAHKRQEQAIAHAYDNADVWEELADDWYPEEVNGEYIPFLDPKLPHLDAYHAWTSVGRRGLVTRYLNGSIWKGQQR